MSTSGGASRAGSFLLLRAGDDVCALPLSAVRRVVRALSVHPLPGAANELLGLAEFGGEPLAILDLARLVRAAPGANPACPVTVVVWKNFIGLGLYEIIPGFILASLTIWVVSLMGKEPAADIQRRFEVAEKEYQDAHI